MNDTWLHDIVSARAAMDDATYMRLATAAKERISSLEAARMAYAKEFPLNAEGEPDVGNIHKNIRDTKQRLDSAMKALRRARLALAAAASRMPEFDSDYQNLDAFILNFDLEKP
ncbi:hypothetical protein [Achromobacter ruhlandii]|uniref:hypothetical protein n=1 Tax=Achromobacter ruhlandii TaxID=72557 RepID=UPI0022B90A24|nr:hypothetical protein [Achromobacter ruhlandii]MCZ8434545.1 hypothetical protein [Achromobacter ruhlandii]MDC6153632.1 hypothetical protein [Achromobacter ruhlandii]MDD7983075.1 hypothetical protein [Achromobacter ruhlandii]